jgi:hypothetical protein
MHGYLPITVAAGVLLAGCSLIRVDNTPAAAPAPVCLPMPEYSQSDRNKVADELGDLVKRNPAAVIPGWIRAYLKLRAENAAACQSQTH